MVAKVISSKIKVIKKPQGEAASAQTEQKDPKEAVREMVSTVSQWVSEFQQKRREETSRVLKSLMPEPPAQTSEA
ncbi:MAG: hypothetical protein C4334_07320 [Pyrinomonas sp.]|uniref:hypothetical protein n=1 Tax=Pyrinomonas sp. TaxID=2080306 RepID=UPI0033219FC7